MIQKWFKKGLQSKRFRHQHVNCCLNAKKINHELQPLSSGKQEVYQLTRLWMAVAGVVVTVTWSTPSAAEVEETRMAFITLGSIHPGLTFTNS